MCIWKESITCTIELINLESDCLQLGHKEDAKIDRKPDMENRSETWGKPKYENRSSYFQCIRMFFPNIILNLYGDKLAFIASERSIVIYFHLCLGKKCLLPMIFNYSKNKTKHNTINKCIASTDLRWWMHSVFVCVTLAEKHKKMNSGEMWIKRRMTCEFAEIDERLCN